jgi:hypothetical protein
MPAVLTLNTAYYVVFHRMASYSSSVVVYDIWSLAVNTVQAQCSKPLKYVLSLSNQTKPTGTVVCVLTVL